MLKPCCCFYFVRDKIWYKIDAIEFKEMCHFNKPTYKNLYTMVYYKINDDYALIHLFYKPITISKFDVEYDKIMYGVDYGKT